jgi:hypothetical protein
VTRFRLCASLALLAAFASVACYGKAGSAVRYPVGTQIDVILSELGPPDADRPYAADSPQSVCPAQTVRLVNYTGPRVPFLIHGALAILCVDSSSRVIKVLFSDS